MVASMPVQGGCRRVGGQDRLTKTDYRSVGVGAGGI